jgi:carboxylesterase
MLRVALGLVAVALLVHLVRYRLVMGRTRAAEAARLPLGDDGVVPGAGSFTLPGSATHAVLLIHGFGDTTQSLRLLAEHLHAVHGWTVRTMLLPGHGRSLAEFDAFGSSAWRAAVHDEFMALRSRFATVALVGLSMGGALATIEAAAHPDLPALVLLVPYLTPPASTERLAPMAGVVNLLVPYLAGGDRTRSILDPVARARTLGAGAVPPVRIRDLVAVAHDARDAASQVTAPVLLVHSTTDYRIPTPLAERHAGYFTSAAACEQVWVTGSGHVITVDYSRDEVFALTASWLARHAGPPHLPNPETA